MTQPKNLSLLAAGAACAFAMVPVALAQDAQDGHGKREPTMLGIHWARGAARPASTGAGTSPNMTFHGGTIMTSVVVESIFWGTSWSTDTSDKKTGIDTFYKGLGSSNYDGTNTEYVGNNGQVGTGIAYAASYVDTSAAPSRAPKTSAILSEVCKVIPNPVANGYYPVYTDQPRGHAGYCAWHSWGSCRGVNIQFAFFFKLDGDAGCDPQDSSNLHSQGLAALANVSGHEISEAQTDPRGDGWFDGSGSENADKCAWSFGTPLLTLTNGSQWKLQGNWSNAAYNNGMGYPNRSGQKGCLDGGVYR